MSRSPVDGLDELVILLVIRATMAYHRSLSREPLRTGECYSAGYWKRLDLLSATEFKVAERPATEILLDLIGG